MYTFAKDGITVTTILDTRRPKGEKEVDLYPVKIRVTYQRERKYYSTSKELCANDWENLHSAKSKAAIHLKANIENSFSIIRSHVEALADKNEFCFDLLNIRLNRSTDNTLNSIFRARIARLNQEARLGNMLWYDNVLKGIERFRGANIPIASITVDWLKRYEQFLVDENKKRSSISMHFRAIRAIVNEAKTIGVMKESQYPFGKGKFEIQEGEGRKIALTLNQIQDIINFSDGSEATDHYRDLWFFIYLCNGINVADLIKLKFSNIIDGEICFVRQKTARTSKKVRQIVVTITPDMQRIIDRWGDMPLPQNYIFPFLCGGESAAQVKVRTQDVTRRINKRMKMIGEKLGIGSISTYTARHSFASVLKRSGANIAYISESLGHNDLKTTESYLASFEKEERQKNAALLTNFNR